MTYATFYLICFTVGLLFSVLSFAGGFAHLHISKLHFGHSRVAHNANHISPFNAFSLLAFLCWFGGAGYLLTLHSLLLAPIILLLAVISGISGAALIFGFLVKVLLPRERILLPQDTDMRGVVARVSSTLRQDGLGEIIFSLNGTRRASAARSENGEAIPRDTQVLVLRYEQGVAWVRPWTELDDLHTPI